jgi:alpha-D-ribose 1-methylphosphonate 5-triphosphate synthase subunit PhnI
MSSFFDPNHDRTARLTRNGLSSAFMEDMQDGMLGAVHAFTTTLTDLKPIHQQYIDNRLAAYQRVLQVMLIGHVTDILKQALVLWDEELFFEVHECLEREWLTAIGDRKAALQALIRGAGAYVHLLQGNTSGAKKMGLKAEAGLREFAGELVSIDQVLAPLCQALLNLDTPPKLYGLTCHE